MIGTDRPPEADVQIFTVTGRELPSWTGRKLCHCSACVCLPVYVGGCTAALLNARARGSCSTGSVRRDGGMQDTERGREDAGICVREGESSPARTTSCSSSSSLSFLTFLFCSHCSLSSPPRANISSLLSFLTLADYITTI